MKAMLLILTGATLTVAAPGAMAAGTNQTCQAVSHAEIAGLFDRWNASLATLRPEEVIKNYADDAVLLPTLSNKPHVNQSDRIQYFTSFLTREPPGRIDSRVIRIGCNAATDSGIYTFTLKDGTKVPARYSFAYEYHKGKWLITSHHSSMMPEKESQIASN